MAQIELPVLEALARLSRQEPQVVKWLQERLGQAGKAAVYERDDVLSRWAQGRAQELGDILAELQQAAENVNKRRT